METLKPSISWMKTIMILIYLLAATVLPLENIEVVLTPKEKVSVCSGEQLAFMCSANVTTLRWNITVPNYPSATRLVTTDNVLAPIVVSTRTFNVTRNSSIGALPLVSTLLISSISSELVGTQVACTVNQIDSNSDVVISRQITTIDVIRVEENDYPLHISSREIFESESISVTLEWMGDTSGVVYTVNSLPRVPVMTRSMDAELRLSYNLVYNVSIVATLCGRSTVTTVQFHYAKCPRPFTQETTVEDGDLFLEGTNVTFTCPPGLTLSGPTTSSCVGSRWKPDPMEAKCLSNCGAPLVGRNDIQLTYYNSTLEGSQLTFWCEGSPNETLTASCLKGGRWSVDFERHDCTYNNNMSVTDNLMDFSITIVLIPSGALLGILIIFIGITITTCIVTKKRGLWSRNNVTMQDSETKPMNDYQFHYEYVGAGQDPEDNSFLQQPVADSEAVADMDLIPIHQQRIPVYADIRATKKTSTSIAVDVQSHRVEYAQISHDVCEKKLELKTHNMVDSADDSLNLDSLLIQLRSQVTPKWYQFGEAIGVEKEVLNKCVKYSPEECIVDVLDNWLRNHAGQPTWREVAEALRSIDLNQLAFDIEKVYETGKLPIQVDMNAVPLGMFCGSEDDHDDEIPPPIPPRIY